MTLKKEIDTPFGTAVIAANDYRILQYIKQIIDNAEVKETKNDNN